MTSFELNDSNICEADSIQMKILEPNPVVLPIPDQRANNNTCLQIAIGITNNTRLFWVNK